MKIKRQIRNLLSVVLITATLVTPISAEGVNGERSWTQNVSPIAHFDFSDGAKDTIGNNHGELYQVTVEEGVANFKGSGYIALPKELLADMVEDQLSLTTWVNLNKNPAWTNLVSVGRDNKNYAVLATRGNPHGKPCGYTMATMQKDQNLGTEDRVKATVAQAVATGKWVHLSYTQSGDIAKLYIDGVLVGESNLRHRLKEIANHNDAIFWIGKCKMFNDPMLSGQLDDFKVYNTALTAEQISSEIDAKKHELLYKEAIEYAQNILDFIVNHGQTSLPSKTPTDIPLVWQVLDGQAEIRNGIVYKTPGAAENEEIRLQVTIQGEVEQTTYIYDKLILKDAYTAHVMSYFNGSESSGGMRLAYSYDGVNWMPLNNGEGVLKATGGSTNWIRDPYIFRKKDGTFGVVSTQGWDTPYIFMWETDDLINYQEHYLKAARPGAVSSKPVQNLTGKRAWAPEVVYDRKTGKYYVFWADPKTPYNDGIQDRPLYYNTSEDLTSLSDPLVYFETGYRIIDGTIVKDQDDYYMFFKHEENGHKKIHVAKSKSMLPGSFKELNIIASDPHQQVEGPFVFQSIADDKWYLYYDYFASHHTYGYSVANDLSSGDWEIKGVSQTLPTNKLGYQTRISHGGQITVTQTELNRLIDHWGIAPVKLKVLTVGQVQGIEVSEGTSFSQLDLPTTVSAFIDDGGYRQLEVQWHQGNYDGNQSGTYNLSGNIILDGILNENNIKATISVKVN